MANYLFGGASICFYQVDGKYAAKVCPFTIAAESRERCEELSLLALMKEYPPKNGFWGHSVTIETATKEQLNQRLLWEK